MTAALLDTEGEIGTSTTALRATGLLNVAALLAPAALTCALSLSGAGRQLNQDELATWWNTALTRTELFQLLGIRDLVLAPYYLLMRQWVKIFGDSSLAMHVPSVIAMTGAAFFVGLLGRRMFDATTGLVAGLIFAVIPGVSVYGQQARPYAFAVLGVTAATLALWEALHRATWWPWLTYGVALTLAGMAHIVSLGVLAGHVVLVATQHQRRRQVGWWALSVVVALVPLAPLAYYGRGQSTDMIAWVGQNVTWQAFVNIPAEIMLSPVVLGIVLGLAALGLCRIRQWRKTLGVAAWAIVPPVAYFTVLPDFFLDRYLFFTVPAWAVLAALAVRFVSVRRPLVTGLVVVGLIALLGFNDQVKGREPAPDGRDFRSAAAFIAQQARPGDAIGYGNDPRINRAMRFELHNVPGHPPYMFPDIGIEGGCVDVCIATLGSSRVWIVRTEGEGPFDGRLYIIADAYRLVSTYDFEGVRVMLVEHT